MFFSGAARLVLASRRVVLQPAIGALLMMASTIIVARLREWYCFEVNPSPGYTYFENGMTHVNLELAKFLANAKDKNLPPEPSLISDITRTALKGFSIRIAQL